MRKFYVFLVVFFIAFVVVSPFDSAAQQRAGHKTRHVPRQTEILFFVPEDIVYNDIADVLKRPEEKHFQDARAPRFLLIDQKEKFALGIGGFVRLVNGMEFKGIIDTETDEGFQPALIPVPNGDNPRSQYRLSASTSQFFVKMVGRTKRLGDFSVYLSTNFEGTNYTPQLRQAYIQFCGFTFGQAWSTIADLSSLPPTIDYASPNGFAGILNPMIRYSRSFLKERMKFAIATEFPSLNGTFNAQTRHIAQSVPDIIGYLQFNLGKGTSHVRVTGILRNLAYRNLDKEKSEMSQGWGAQVSGLWTVHHKLSFYYQFIYGKGIATYLNDLSNLNSDLVPNPEKPGYLQALPMWGGYAGVQYNFTKDVFASVTYSQSRMYSDRGYAPSGLYKYGQYLVTNVFWNVTENCQLAMEYLHGRKVVHGGESGKANRINLMVQYNF